MVRPKLFFDTNICIYAANGTIPADEWARVSKYVGRHYRYCISFITLKELFGKVTRGQDTFFEKNKKPLQVLYGTVKRSFLPFPTVFAIRTVLGLPVARKSKTSELSEEVLSENMLKAVLRVSSKAELEAGIPVRNSHRWKHRFDLDHFDEHENQPQHEHAGLLQGMRQGLIERPDAMKWAAWILHQHEVTPYDEDCQKLVATLDAAYLYGVSLSRFTDNPNYNFHKPEHLTSWGDTLQMLYLCDNHMHFLTTDKDFLDYTKGSFQADRIHLYRNFVRSVLS
jgi:hypothetical protein